MTPEVAKLLADNGPWAVVIFLGGLIGFALWREHLRADVDDRAQRDLAQDLLRVSLANNAAAIAAWNKRTDQDAARARKADR